MQEVFQNALFHREPIVLRRQLLPLSLAHIYALMIADSPFVVGGSKTLLDLALAVLICTLRWEQIIPVFADRHLIRRCERWGRRCRKLDVNEESERFAQYLEDFVQFPDRFDDGKNRMCKHPWPLLIAVKLMEQYPEDRVWNMPLPLAFSYWSAMAELQGDRTLKSDQDMADIEAQVAHREQQKQEWLAKQEAKTQTGD